MWPFKRQNKQDEVPPEVENYYQSERRERVGVAWLLALATLVITVVLAAALFLGGRWTYRQIAGNDESAQTETGQTSSTTTDDTGNTPTPEPTPSDEQSADDGDTATDGRAPQDQADANNEAPVTDAPNGQTAGDATTTEGPDELVDTGPGDLSYILGVFVITTLVGAAAHRLVLARD